jgi:hypothetical protein
MATFSLYPSTTKKLDEANMQSPTATVQPTPSAANVASPTKTPSYISSEKGIDIINQDQQKLDDIKTQALSIQDQIKTLAPEKPTDTTPKEDTTPKTGGFTPEELTGAGIKDPLAEGLTFDPATNQYFSSPNTQANQTMNAYTEYQNKIQTAGDNLASENDWVLGQMKTAIMGADADLAESLAQITSDYQMRKTQLEDINKRTLSAFSTALSRGGTSRYLPTLRTTLMASEERTGIQKLSELANQAQSLIIEAKNASKTKKFTDLNTYLQKLDEVRTQQAQTAKEIMTSKVEYEKELEKEVKAQQQKQTLIDILSDGKLDIENIQQSIEAGLKTSDIKEINELLKIATGDESVDIEKFSGDIRDFMMLKQAYPEMVEGINDPFQYKEALARTTASYINAANKAVAANSSGASLSGVARGTEGEISISSLADIDKLPVGDLTKSVIAGYAKLKELTPTQKAEVATELYKVGFNPNTYIMKKLNGLIALYSNVPENYVGAIQGFATPNFIASHVDEKVATFESARSVLTREIARLNDVGVLSDQDVASYENAMPSRRDNSIGIALGKVAGLAQTITGKGVSENVGKTGKLEDGRAYIVGYDGETLLDPKTGKEL